MKIDERMKDWIWHVIIDMFSPLLKNIKKLFYRLSLANMDVRVSRMVIAIASLSAMLFGGRKSANQEMAKKTVETM